MPAPAVIGGSPPVRGGAHEEHRRPALDAVLAPPGNRRYPKEHHWLLGPIAAEPVLRGGSIGTRMMERFAMRVEPVVEAAYVETDKLEIVRFYEG